MVTVWRRLEDIVPGEVTQSPKAKHGVIPRLWKSQLLETERETVGARGWRRGRAGVFMGTEGLFGKAEKSLGWRG